MEEYSHYIRLDGDKNVTHIFSDAFEQPSNDDILIKKSSSRHFNMDIKYKDTVLAWCFINNELVKKSESELELLWEQSKKTDVGILEQTEARVRAVEDVLLELMNSYIMK